MKKFILLIGILLTINSCSEKKETELTPLEQLPKATKVGANTAGCLVNGEAFLPKGFFPSGNLICYFINQNYFSLDISNKENIDINTIFISAKNLNIIIDEPVNLNMKRDLNSKFAEYNILRNNGNDELYSTTPQITGELVITYHDYNNAIISGTFWFDAINNNGEKVEVREGRFDMKY